MRATRAGAAVGAVVAALLAVALGACSGSGSGSPTAAPPAASSTVAGAATSGPATSVPAGPTSSAPAATPTAVDARCHSADLSLKADGGGAATGHAVAVFDLVNTATRACTLTGYPGVAALGGQGATLVSAAHGPGFILADAPPATVMLGPGQAAYFGVEWTNVCAGGVAPVSSSSLSVTPPGETASLLVAASVTVCPGSQSVLVSPVRAAKAEVSRG